MASASGLSELDPKAYFPLDCYNDNELYIVWVIDQTENKTIMK